jgi:hypothetical protein
MLNRVNINARVIIRVSYKPKQRQIDTVSDQGSQVLVDVQRPRSSNLARRRTHGAIRRRKGLEVAERRRKALHKAYPCFLCLDRQYSEWELGSAVLQRSPNSWGSCILFFPDVHWIRAFRDLSAVNRQSYIGSVREAVSLQSDWNNADHTKESKLGTVLDKERLFLCRETIHVFSNRGCAVLSCVL